MSSLDTAWLSALRAAALELLEARPEGLGEHALLRALMAEPGSVLAGTDFDDPVSLFRSHFLLFHALYRLRDGLLEERRGVLRIHCLRIALDPYAAAEPALAEGDPMRSYYLDLENLGTTREELEEMLRSFWRRMDGTERRAQALAVLGLDEDAGAERVRQRYRQLALRHHPDRGGDAEAMAQVNAAMAQLR